MDLSNIITIVDTYGSKFMFNINNIRLTYSFIIFTNAVNILIVFGVLLIMWAIWGKKVARYGFFNVSMAFILNFIIKNIVRRERPALYLRIVNASGYSFPSAHTMVAIALYGFLIYIIHTKVENKKIRITMNTFLVMLIIIIGISRIYLGVHYTTDVICGYLAGLTSLILFIRFIYKKDRLKKICTYTFFKKKKK